MIPSTSYTGSECVVACAVSMQPPWSMATSTITAPGCISESIVAADELRGARARDEHGADHDVGVRDPLLDLEARRHEEADAAGEDLVEVPHAIDRALEDRDLGAEPERDDRGVVADDPAAEDDDAAGLDAGGSARGGRRARRAASRGSAPRPAARAVPAISLIGASSGRRRSSVSTVSYATAAMPLSMSARVNGSSAAMWRYVKRTSPSRRRAYSGSIGSLTLRRSSESAHTDSTEPIFAPARS